MMVRERQAMVREFMRHMGWASADEPEMAPPGLVRRFTDKLLEEVGELVEAAAPATGQPDIVEVVDALRDIEYLLYGIELLFGVQDASDDSFLEVHWSNMTKRMEQDEVTKPSGFCKPRIAELLRKKFPSKRLLFRS
jgi:predicted HAD superfamily Cof-like phosphohydrolase